MLLAILFALQQALAEVVVNSWVCAATDGAGHRNGADPGAFPTHQKLGARSDERRLRSPDAEAEAARVCRAEAVEHFGRMEDPMALDAYLACDHHFLELARPNTVPCLYDRLHVGLWRFVTHDLEATARIWVSERNRPRTQ